MSMFVSSKFVTCLACLTTPISRISALCPIVAACLTLFLLSSHAYAAQMQATLAWDDFKNDPQNIGGYYIYYWETTNPTDVQVEDMDNPTPCPQVSRSFCHTVTGLQAGATYEFNVTAYDLNYQESVPSKTVSKSFLPIEIGEVHVKHTWTWVPFSVPFRDPVVVASSLSLNGSDPAVVRIESVDQAGNVYTTGFWIRVQEWDYLGGWHAFEDVGYIVMERGSYTLNNGTVVEAGRFATNKTSFFGWVPFSPLSQFQVPPVVLTAIASLEELDAVTGRIRDVSTAGFKFRMQEQESNAQQHRTEIIAYIAWEPSAGIDGLTFEAGTTMRQHQSQTLLFGTPFINTPVLVADIQTTKGGDTANLRWKNKDINRVDMRIDEEGSSDMEIRHRTETVGYLAIAVE